MAYNIVVPDLSESVVEATVAEWLKSVGDAVSAGDVVVILETDKVSLEVAAEQDGVISEITQDEGADVVPGDVLGVIDGEGGDSSAPAGDKSSASDNSKQKEEAQPEKAAPAPSSSGGQKATPVAQRFAAEHQVDLSQVKASGDKITKEDVQSHIDGQKSQPAPQKQAEAKPEKREQKPAPTPQADNGRREERIRMSRRRQTIARRMVEAQSAAAMLTTFNEIDMTAVMDLRKRRKEAFKERYGINLGLSSFFVKATISALKAFPPVNGEIQDKEIVLKHYYDIGIAIGAEDGLIVPILRDADRMSFAEIEKQVRDYATQVSEGTLSIDALTGGTFTITNGGIFGSMMSTPILNPPQVGILGLHGITERPVARDGEVVIRPMMYVALTYDHRIIDGREAVQFLVHIKRLIEDPETLLIEG
ncbi:MAG: 2-oxoglutarate dehydrogenase complex dihydrolipoyllysine-residue succinyltransferase [Anaerolineaceae bacterium]|nr:MAG: 2-oxoglutarate dehydrogenase complex dihydrolipoyllysine-residue succinyltransferase [Anaerolineaceae bacterium]